MSGRLMNKVAPSARRKMFERVTSPPVASHLSCVGRPDSSHVIPHIASQPELLERLGHPPECVGRIPQASSSARPTTAAVLWWKPTWHARLTPGYRAEMLDSHAVSERIDDRSDPVVVVLVDDKDAHLTLPGLLGYRPEKALELDHAADGRHDEVDIEGFRHDSQSATGERRSLLRSRRPSLRQAGVRVALDAHWCVLALQRAACRATQGVGDRIDVVGRDDDSRVGLAHDSLSLVAVGESEDRPAGGEILEQLSRRFRGVAGGDQDERIRRTLQGQSAARSS